MYSSIFSSVQLFSIRKTTQIKQSDGKIFQVSHRTIWCKISETMISSNLTSDFMTEKEEYFILEIFDNYSLH